MGYGYGIWLLIDNGYLQEHLNHLGHVTLICNMSKDNMKQLYLKLLEQHIKENNSDMNYSCIIDDKKGVIFKSNMYSKTEKELAAWGYNCKVLEDKIIDVIAECNYYEGDTPEEYHVTMEYKMKEEELTIHDMFTIESLKCHIVMADIRDDEPKNWIIIDKEETLNEYINIINDETIDNIKPDIIEIRKYLVEIYTEHNPKCLSKIDSMLDKYKGREHRLLQKVYKKYIG